MNAQPDVFSGLTKFFDKVVLLKSGVEDCFERIGFQIFVVGDVFSTHFQFKKD